MLFSCFTDPIPSGLRSAVSKLSDSSPFRYIAFLFFAVASRHDLPSPNSALLLQLSAPRNTAYPLQGSYFLCFAIILG